MKPSYKVWNGLESSTGFPRRKSILEFDQAKKTMEVKMEAEKFRVGSKVRLLERKVLKLQAWIAAISMVCICLAVLAQEITFYGTYSNKYGGNWFDTQATESEVHSAQHTDHAPIAYT
jgi:hypothetical protein